MVKTKNRQYSIATAFYDKNKQTIEILPISELKKANSIATYNHETLKQLDISELYQDGSLFFYKLENYELDPYGKRFLESYEKGFGRLFPHENKLYLIREWCFESYEHDSLDEDRISASFISFSQDTHLIITSYQPENMMDYTVVPYSVLATRHSFSVDPVQLEENSVLGRMDEEISSLDIKDVIKEGLSTINKKITSPSSAFELTSDKSMVISRSLVARPSKTRPKTPRTGQIIFNDRTKCFEGYDGNSWKTLQWGDDK